MNKFSNYINYQDVENHYMQQGLGLDGFYGPIYDQSGDGLGSLISGFVRAITPVGKVIAKKVIPVVKTAAKKIFIPSAKEVISTGIEKISKSVVEGKKPDMREIGLSSLKAGAKRAGSNILNELAPPPPSKRNTINRRHLKKRRHNRRTLF